MAANIYFTVIIIAAIMAQNTSMAEITRQQELKGLAEKQQEVSQQAAESVQKTAEETENKNNESDSDRIASLMPYQPSENSSAVGYNDAKSWWFKRNSTNTPPTAQGDIAIQNYDAYYLGDVSSKVIYLTFDEGYENGCSEKILDILKENNVKAAFFVTKTYIESEPDLVRRMVTEGHIVGNHSVTHPDMTAISDSQIADEINGCAQYFKEITGQDMPKFFRPPQGKYSIRTLEKTKELGYKTIFWSFAYKDWLTDAQPGAQTAYSTVVGGSHDGCIMLLHAVSESNTEALDKIIKDLKAQGYSFDSLENLP